MPFRWNEWNLEHAAKHGVSPKEAESVVDDAEPPYPEQVGNGKFRVVGRGVANRFIQVIYVLDADDTLYIIHARPLTDAEKRKHRRRTR